MAEHGLGWASPLGKAARLRREVVPMDLSEVVCAVSSLFRLSLLGRGAQARWRCRGATCPTRELASCLFCGRWPMMSPGA
eukprot:6739736-Prymnesium_polylepis.1